MYIWLQCSHGIRYNFNLGFDMSQAMENKGIIHMLSWHLENIPRFNGASSFFSVAQHSVLCLKIIQELRLVNPGTNTSTINLIDGNHHIASTPRLYLHTLLHDAHEAILGDITSPVEAALGSFCRAEIKQLKEKIQNDILVQFDILPPTQEESNIIEIIDLMALWLEKENLFHKISMPWSIDMMELKPHVKDTLKGIETPAKHSWRKWVDYIMAGKLK